MAAQSIFLFSFQLVNTLTSFVLVVDAFSPLKTIVFCKRTHTFPKQGCRRTPKLYYIKTQSPKEPDLLCVI